MKCKVCASEAPYQFSRKVTRLGFEREARIYVCSACGMLFTDAWDTMGNEEMGKLYHYPEYLTFDVGAAKQRRLPRARALVRAMVKKYQYNNPRILMHGNGSCLSPHWLRQDGFDVHTSFDHLADWPYRIDPSESRWECMFDIISSTEVAEHFVDPVQEFARMMELLKPGGVACGSTCFFDGKDETLEAIRTDRFHYTHDYHWNGGLAVMYTETAMDIIADKIGASRNETEKGDPVLRTESLMPATSYFYQLIR